MGLGIGVANPSPNQRVVSGSTYCAVSASSMRRAGRITLSSSTCWPCTMVTSALAAVERSVSGAYTR